MNVSESGSGCEEKIHAQNKKKNYRPWLTGLPACCVSVGAPKRSSDTVPPVGGAQRSQVAVGGAGEEEEGAETGQRAGIRGS